MLEVSKRRPDPAEQARKGPGHPELLRASGERKRINAVRHELGMPGDRGEAQLAAGHSGKCPEQVLDVRLVAGPLAAENVGIDDDERRGRHAASR